jgi:hypothetical protein
MENNQFQPDIKVERHRLAAFFMLISATSIILGGAAFLLYLIGGNGIYRSFAVLIALFLVVLILVHSFWHIVTQHIFASDAVLIINQQGIHIGKLPREPDSVFIPWAEIEAIYSYRSLSVTFLCIRPKILQPYLSRFGCWKQAFRAIKMRTGAPLNIQQDWMRQPINEILRQIHLKYEQELFEYNISLND